MKKIYTLAFLFLGILSTAQAQIKFTFNGNDVAAGDTVRIMAHTEDWGGGYCDVIGATNENGNNLRIVNTGTSAVSATIVCSVVSKTTPESIAIQLCVGDICNRGTTSLTKNNVSLSTGATGTPADWDVIFQEGTTVNYGIVKTTYVVTVGSKSYTCLVNFENPDPAAAIQDLNAKIASKQSIVYDLTGKRVNSVKHGFYIVNGKKVYLK